MCHQLNCVFMKATCHVLFASYLFIVVIFIYYSVCVCWVNVSSNTELKKKKKNSRNIPANLCIYGITCMLYIYKKLN